MQNQVTVKGHSLSSWLRGVSRGWLPGILLALPATLPYISHFAATEGRIPTGFIEGDQAYYMANAREHFDSGGFTFLYGNPFDGSPDTPRVYWQPHILLLGILLHLTGFAPGAIYVAFGLCGVIVCARVALAMYRESPFADLHPGPPLLLVYFWGGGLLVIAGALYSLPGFLRGEGFMAGDFLRLDPGDGWWFLNFGRNLVFPTEAFYHALFFGCIVFLFRRKYVGAALCAGCLSASHPFTGLELLAVLSAWMVVELVLGGADRPPPLFVISILALLIAHVAYYLLFLPSIPEHRQLMDQWEQPWILRPLSALFAYTPMAAVAFWTLRKRGSALFRDRSTRLLLVWFAVAFALANHQYVIRAVQPLHFTRGYIWTPLFLLAAPGLQDFFRSRKRGMKSFAAIACVVTLLCADNAVWLGLVTSGRTRSDILLTKDERALLEWVNQVGDGRTLVVSGIIPVDYLATVYTPARAWVAHRFNTPKSSQREKEVHRFIDSGRAQPAWGAMRVIVITSRGEAESRLGLWIQGGTRNVERQFTNTSFDGVLLGLPGNAPADTASPP